MYIYSHLEHPSEANVVFGRVVGWHTVAIALVSDGNAAVTALLRMHALSLSFRRR